MSRYAWIRFDCPGCGRRLRVEAGQVRGRQVVACTDCGTRLVLAPAGEGNAEATRRRFTDLRRAPKDAVVVEVPLR